MLLNFSNASGVNNNLVSFQKRQQNTQPSDSIDLYKAQKLRQSISDILKEDQQRKHPVIESIKPDTIEKLVDLANTKRSKPYIIGVAGGSGSGKTTIVKIFTDLINKIIPHYNSQKPFIQNIKYDNFYYDFSEEVRQKGSDEVMKTKDLDCPQALDTSLLIKKLNELKQGKDIKTPEFLLNNSGIRIEDNITVKTSPIVTLEGLFTLWNKNLRNLLDLKIFIEASKEVRSKRWWDRAKERNIEDDEVGRAFYNRTFNNHDIYVEPTKRYADIVINADGDQKDVQKVLRQITT